MKFTETSQTYSYSEIGLELSQIYNKDTLNIFSDASMINGTKPKLGTGCYGAVAVCRDQIIDSFYRISSRSTNNSCEIKGLRAAILLANKWKDQFCYINIFSDSQISVFGLKDYIYKWKYNPKDGKLYNSNGSVVSNQSTFIECHQLLMYLYQYPNMRLRLFHQNGHVNNGYYTIKEAGVHFMKANNIAGVLDLNLIRYISTYNNYVDQTTRSLLRRANLKDEKLDPILFMSKGKINRQ